MLCIVSYHHEIVVELGEYCFYTLAESLVCPGWRTPVFLIQPIRDFKSYISCLKEVFLNLGTEITFVSKHHTVMIFPTHIIEVMDVMYACRSHVIGMYHTSYPAHSMEFITVIVQTLRGAVSPIRSGLRVVSAHDTTFRPCVLADLYRLGINAEHVLRSVNGDSNLLADFLGKSGRQLTTDIELPAADLVWQIVLALMSQTMKKKIFAIESESLGGYAESDDFEVGKLRNNATTGYVSKFIYTIPSEILADSENSNEICYEVAHKQSNSS